MIIMKTKFYFILLFIFTTMFATAQTPPVSYYKKMKEITKELDSTNFKNNTLYDRVYPLAKLDEFNQNQRIDTSNAKHYKQAVNELYLASNKLSKIFDSEELKQTIYNSKNFNKIAIGIVNADFTILKPNSLDPTNPLITNDDSVLLTKYHEVENKNPYKNKQTLVIAVLEEQINQGSNPTIFTFDQSILEKTINPIKDLFVKFANGQMYQIIANGIKTTTEFGFTFTANGKQSIEFYGTYSNNLPFKTFASVFINIVVMNPLAKCESDIIKFRATEIFTPYENDTPALPSYATSIVRDERVEIEYKIYYSGSECVLRKPILIMDGIDYDDSRKIPLIYDEILTQKDNPTLKLGNKLRDLGYDVVIANFPIYSIAKYQKPLVIGHEPELITRYVYREGGADYIQRNAKGIKQLIKTLNTTLTTNNSSEKLVVVGPSMGGLVSRWALKELEDENYNHNTKLWVSFDSPHQGANIPLGLKYLAEYGENFDSLDKLNRPASKQILVNHYLNGSTSSGGAPNFRDRFSSELATLCYPINNIRKISLVNGATTGTLNGVAGQQLASLHVWFTSFPYANAAFGEAYLSNNSGVNKVLEVRERSSNFVNWTTTQKFIATNNNIGSYDVAPGCKFSLTGSASIGGYRNIMSPTPLLVNLFGNVEQLVDKFTFMSTKSTLDFKGNSLLLTEPLNNRNLVTTHETPFDAYYTPPTNEEHLELNTANVAWLLNELNTVSNTNLAQNVICTPRVSSIEITGSSVICDVIQRDYLLIPNNLTNVSWTVTNLQIMSSSNQGIRVRRLNPYQTCVITATYNGGIGAGTIQATKFLSCNRPNLRFAVNFKNNETPTFNLADLAGEFPLTEQNITNINWEKTSGDGSIYNSNTLETEVAGTNFTGIVTVTNQDGDSYSQNFFYPNSDRCKIIQKTGFDLYQVIDRCNNNIILSNISQKEVYTVYGYKLEDLPLNSSFIDPNLGIPGDIQILHVVSDGEHLTKRIIKK